MHRALPVLLVLPIVMLASCAATPTNKTVVLRKTDRGLDLAIDGEGFFIVQTTPDRFLFTRAGAISVATSGELVNEDGYKIVSSSLIPPETSNLTVTSEGSILAEHAGQAAEVKGQIVLARFAHPDKLEKDGIYRLPTEASGDPITAAPGRKGLGVIVTGALETP